MKLMQSLPNSGSTWIAQLVADTTPGMKYCYEYFNPLRNVQREAVLSKRFGCETVQCFRHIAYVGSDDDVLDDIDATWPLDGYNFTKEVFSPLKLSAFAQRFDCVVFLRKAEHTFPPGRLRVWSFYEHAWHALRLAGVDLSATLCRARAVEAHEWMVNRMLRDADRLGVPVIWWHELMAGDVDDVWRALARCKWMAHDELHRAVIETRDAARLLRSGAAA